MKAPVYIYNIVLCALIIPCTAQGLKILGGFTDVYDITSSTKHGTRYQWGAHQTGVAGTNVIGIGSSYCWNSFTNSRGYCYQKLVVSTQNDPTEEHYEILGSKLVVMDSQSRYTDRTRHAYGLQFAGPSESDFIVYSGESWSPGNNAWGYAYLHFIVKRTTRASVTDAFSWQARNAGSEQFTQTENFAGTKASTSTRETIGQFRCWTSAWREDSNCYRYLWKAQTRLVSYSLQYDDKEILGVTTVPKVRPLILENHGSGLSTIDFPRIQGTEQVTTTSTARFSSTFDFSIDISTEIGFNAFGASSTVGFNSHFGFSSTSEMSNTVSDSTTLSITWPSSCDPGFRLTYNVAEHSERQRIPVVFVFDRAGSQWTETKDVEVSLTWIEINANDCCLYAYASQTCGTERLPMC